MQCAAIKTRTLFFSRQLRQLHNWNVWIELINNWNSLSDHRAINTYLGNFFLIIFLQWKSTKNRNDYFLCCQSVHIMCTNVNTFFSSKFDNLNHKHTDIMASSTSVSWACCVSNWFLIYRHLYYQMKLCQVFLNWLHLMENILLNKLSLNATL